MTNTKNQKNIELYLVLVVIVAIFLAGIFGVAVQTAYTEILLAALAILMYGLIDSRHHNDRVERILAEQSNRLSKFEARISQISKAMVYKTSTRLRKSFSYLSLSL
jgi:hypothetical protein